MSERAAVTIRRSEEEIAAALGGESSPFGPDAEVSFRPAPGDRGTEVRVVLHKQAKGGVLGAKLAALIGSDPGRQLDDSLRRFKQILETGQVVRSDGSPEGTDARRQRLQEAAQPDANDN